MKHGTGCYKWEDGRLYYGSYENDQKNGQGIYRWADGKIYIGNWVNGDKGDGIRVFIFPNGEIKKNNWENKAKGPYLEVKPNCNNLSRWKRRRSNSSYLREMKPSLPLSKWM